MNTLRFTMGATLLALAVGTLATGCGGVCDKIASYELECGDLKGKDEAKGMLVEMCNQAMSAEKPPRSLAESKECAEKASDCAGYLACKEEKKVARSIDRMKESAEKGEYGTAMIQCEISKEQVEKNEAFKAACVDVASKALDHWGKKNESYRIDSTCKQDWVKGNADLNKKCGEAFGAGLTAAIKEGKFYKLKSSCDGGFAKTDAGKKACADVLGKAKKELEGKIIAVRDGKADKKDVYTHCSNLKTVGEALGGDNKKKGEALCAEAKAGAALKNAKDKVADELKKEKMKLPWACDSAMKDLQSLVPSDWQKKAKQELIDTCYVKLATKILTKEVPEMKYCKYAVKKILEAVDKHKIKNPALDAQVTAARAKCTK